MRGGGRSPTLDSRHRTRREHAVSRRVRAGNIGVVAHTGRGLRGEQRAEGGRPARDARHRADLGRREIGDAAQEPADARRARGPVRGGRLARGAPKHPVWYYNLVANPHVELQDGDTKRDYLAHEAVGEEREIWWERAVAAYPDYAAYATKTDRVIPLFVLEPFEA